MSNTIESLELEIQSNSKSAVSGIDALTQSLGKLKTATKGGLGLTSVVNEIRGLDASATSKVSGLAKAIGLLNGAKISTNIATQLKGIGESLQNLDVSGGKAKMEGLVDALAPLGNLGKTNLASYVSNLKKLPQTFAELSKIDMASFTAKIQELATALKPLGDEMQKVANGFSAFPTKIQKLLNATNQIPISNKNASTSFTDLYHKIQLAGNAIVGFGKKVWSAIKLSMDYTENMNLFSVSMGQYATTASEGGTTLLEDIEKIKNAMGIDPKEWVRAQGIFMTMATGFGVAGDRAATMSKNLTQLGYDLASFYNMDVEDAMTKLKSGLAGELEPLRAIGYDLSQAKLEATALKLGITKSVSAMTQAEKAQLRYYAIMTQVTDAQGDMARTLNDPANQMRVFKAEINMAAREIGNIFIPALNAILPYAISITKVIGTLAQSIAELFGYKPKEYEKTTNKVVENTDELKNNMKGAQEEAKKLKSYMLGFDELNVINPNTGDEDDTSGWVDFKLPEYDFMNGLVESKVSTIVKEMKEWLGITEDIDTWADLFETRLGDILVSVGLIGGAFALWRIAEGVEKTVTAISKLSKLGSFTLGLALVITGVTIGAFAIENALTEGLNSVNATSLLVGGGSFIAGGALIGKAFGSTIIGAAVSAILVGVVGLGIGLYDAIANELNLTNGMVIAGSTTLIGIAVASLIPTVNAAGETIGFTFAKALKGAAVGAIIGAAIIGATWLFQHTESTLTKIGAIISGAFLAVGAILAFTGNLPLGIALMAVGAVSMGTAIALNTDALSDEVKGVITGITYIVSGALLAVGAILAFTGNIPLGIALLAGGALSLVTVVAPNWNYLVDLLRGSVGDIVTLVSSALLALGALMLFSGVGTTLGLALLAAGAVGLVTMVAVNWDSAKSTLKTALSSVLGILSGATLVLGALLLLSGAGIGLGLALIFAGLTGSYTAWKLDDNPITRFMKNMLNAIIGAVNEMITFLNEMVSAFTFGAITIPLIPLLAEGGFPDQGQMFIAREAGAEMVGNIGRRTAVANNDQIVAGIAGGVAEANEEQNALLREQNSLLRALLEKDSGVYLDGKNLTASVEKYQRERGRILVAGGVL